jgi:hypothetical protein
VFESGANKTPSTPPTTKPTPNAMSTFDVFSIVVIFKVNNELTITADLTCSLAKTNEFVHDLK